ncbi:MAG: FTR1 family protein [Firmicutes bacterium]|nr:FTR1 family protein [Bacillota bacterium]
MKISNKLWRMLALLTALTLALMSLSIPVMATTWGQSEGTYANWTELAEKMEEVLEGVKQYYADGDAENAFDQMNRTYYSFYEVEGFEKSAKSYIKASRKTEVEFQFSKIKSAIKKGEPQETVNEYVDGLAAMLKEDAKILDVKFGYATEESADTSNESTDNASTAASSGGLNSGSNSFATFLACFGIILREGFEAILVVGAIIAYLVKSGNKDKLRAVYLGSVIAIFASFAAAMLLNALKLANSANQEIIEGVTALIAVLVLFYVSNWMVSKAEAEAWTKYIEGQVSASVETGSLFTLGFTAFLAVFREGAEVILFYQPLLAEGNPSMVWAGFATGCVVLVIVFLAIRFLSIKLPIKPFFLGTSILMFIMSISFLGSGIKELIEGDVIMMTSPDWLAAIIPSNDLFDVLGIYPCLQTLIPQFILLTITLLIFAMTKWKRNSRVEAGIMAILFGGLGIHKFYVGKYGKGILYAALCWTFIPAIMGVAEGIHFLCESDEEFQKELVI